MKTDDGNLLSDFRPSRADMVFHTVLNIWHGHLVPVIEKRLQRRYGDQPPATPKQRFRAEKWDFVAAR